MYTKSHLISFGNYLLKTYGVRHFSSDGKNTPLETRQVSHADTEAWKDETPMDAVDLAGYPQIKDRPADRPLAEYKANHAIGDPVILLFGTSGYIKNCRITKVHFTGNNASYDVEVKWQFEGQSEFYTNRIHNIDSIRVYSVQDFQETGSTQSEANFVVRLKALVENKLKESHLQEAMINGIERDEREEMLAVFYYLLGEGAVDALKVGDCVNKYIPKKS